jgi:hypothetical protein
MKPNHKPMGFFPAVDELCTEVCTDAWDLGYVPGGPEELMSQYRPWAEGEVV